MSTIPIQTNLLNLRNNFGKYLNDLAKKPVAVTKRGKKVAMVIDPEQAEEFLKWQEWQELRKLYYDSKPIFKEYGRKFLEKRGLKEEDLTADELVDLVANA